MHIANLQDCLDIIATQGSFLVSPPSTPVFESAEDEKFAATLARKLHALEVEQILKRVMYRQTVDEWLIGHPPSEVKAQYDAEVKARVKALEELAEVSSDDSDVLDSYDRFNS
jgi:hypothetical protein